MLSAETRSVIDRAERLYAERLYAERLYAERLQAELEAKQLDRFVAIEPESGEHFLGDTFDEAVNAASAKYPSRISYTLRIGRRGALQM